MHSLQLLIILEILLRVVPFPDSTLFPCLILRERCRKSRAVAKLPRWMCCLPVCPNAFAVSPTCSSISLKMNALTYLNRMSHYVVNDSKILFEDFFAYNPYSGKIASDIKKNIDKIISELPSIKGE